MEYADIGNVNPPDLMKIQNKMGFQLLVEDKEAM